MDWPQATTYITISTMVIGAVITSISRFKLNNIDSEVITKMGADAKVLYQLKDDVGILQAQVKVTAKQVDMQEGRMDRLEQRVSDDIADLRDSVHQIHEKLDNNQAQLMQILNNKRLN